MGSSALPGFLLTIYDKSTLLAVFFTVFALVLDFMKRRKKCQNYPPGPWGLPFVGNIHQVDLNNPHLSFAKLWKEYGNVVSLNFGWGNTVVLNGYETLKEALVKKSEDFAERPDLKIYDHLSGLIGEGIVFAKFGHWWREQRKFSLTTMRNFGLGKKSLDLRIIEEAGFLNKEFESAKGLPFDPHSNINNATANIICSFVFGERFEYQDEKFLEFLRTLEESFALEGGFWGQLVNAFPCIYHLPGPHNKIFKNQQLIIRFMQEKITEHKKSWNPDEPKDFIDAFLTEQEKMKDNPRTSFVESNLIGVLIDLISAGSETTSTTLRWSLLFMVLHPDLQWRRVCLGEQLAKTELFLFFTSLLQHFTFHLPENEPKPKYTAAKYGITLSPLPYRLCAKLR